MTGSSADAMAVSSAGSYAIRLSSFEPLLGFVLQHSRPWYMMIGEHVRSCARYERICCCSLQLDERSGSRHCCRPGRSPCADLEPADAARDRDDPAADPA